MEASGRPGGCGGHLRSLWRGPDGIRRRWRLRKGARWYRCLDSGAGERRGILDCLFADFSSFSRSRLRFLTLISLTFVPMVMMPINFTP